MSRKVKMRIWRGDSKNGEFKDVTVDANEGEVVLDVIHRVQATQMSDLAVRWNCKAGKCGSCSMEINGKPRLACMTRMNSYAEDETITVTPLRAFPVIKDLVTDVSYNYKKAMEVPAFEGPTDLKPGEYRMQQVDVERSQEFRKCIECFLCQNTCHVVRDHEENKNHLPAHDSLSESQSLICTHLIDFETVNKRRKKSMDWECATSPSAVLKFVQSTSKLLTMRLFQ
jgi:succinate dehydrogenase / fumarate reductase iron-sulfur subunit